MTILTSREPDHLLRESTEHLVEDYTPNTRVSVGRVLAAVDRAKRHVLDGYRVLNLDAPSGDEYVALVVGLARQELDNVRGSINSARPRSRDPGLTVDLPLSIEDTP
jgi:hypothetical protein